jgi:hypothetical protein
MGISKSEKERGRKTEGEGGRAGGRVGGRAEQHLKQLMKRVILL